MKNKLTIPAILFCLVALGSIYLIASNKPSVGAVENNSITQENTNIILFYGDGCPHCVIVKEFVEDNNIEEKVQFVKKEVYYNQQNASELGAKAKMCGMPTDSIGVPFLWDGSKCYVGDQDIIEFFKNKSN
jgi:glutaredoxin